LHPPRQIFFSAITFYSHRPQREKDFIKEVETVAKLYSLRAEILARTKNAVKVKVPITENIYIQLYYN